jgi:translation initiation factor IF-3
MRKDNKKQLRHKINNEVRFPQVRLIGNGEPQLMSSYDAFQLALSLEKDLILINENQTPPIVKIEDYKKFLYNTEKAEKEKKRNSIKTVIKEIQLSCEISDHDLGTKSRKGKEFLENGDKIKCVIQLKGRQNHNPQRGELVMLKFVSSLSDLGIAEAMPKLEGSRWIMIIKPKK